MKLNNSAQSQLYKILMKRLQCSILKLNHRIAIKFGRIAKNQGNRTQV